MNWGTAVFRAGSLRLFDDGTWEISIDVHHPERGESATLEDYGEYDGDGEELWFLSEAYDDEFQGWSHGDAITISYDFVGDEGYGTDLTFVD